MIDDRFKQFLYQANIHGYGSADVNRQNLPNGEHIITFTQDEFELRDVYYGGEPYAGQEVIFRDGVAMWAMQYRGSIVEGEDFGPIYTFLGKALTNTKLGLPRGVDGFSDDNFTYVITMNGDLTDFAAEETISRTGELVYFAKFLGGLVDIKREEISSV